MESELLEPNAKRRKLDNSSGQEDNGNGVEITMLGAAVPDAGQMNVDPSTEVRKKIRFIRHCPKYVNYYINLRNLIVLIHRQISLRLNHHCEMKPFLPFLVSFPDSQSIDLGCCCWC